VTTLAVIAILVLALLGLPLFLVIGSAALLGYVVSGQQLELFFASYYLTVSSNPIFIAIPLFTLAGFLMAESRAPSRLVRLSRAAIGWMPGGLAIVALVACAGFTAFTGASGVTIVALGGLLLPALLKDGYPERFTIGLLTSSGSRGILFPPSLPLIVYAMIAGTTLQGAIETMPSDGRGASAGGAATEVVQAPSDRDDAKSALDDEMDRLLAEGDEDESPSEGAAADDDEPDGDAILAEMGIDDVEAEIAAHAPPVDADSGTGAPAIAAGTGPPTAQEPARAAENLTQVSVDSLFVAGALPGLLVLTLIGIYAIFFGVRRKVPRTPFRAGELVSAAWGMFWEIPIPLIIVVGIYGGFFTAIDGAALVAAYVFVVEVLIYRDIPLRRLPVIFRESMVLVGGILLILMSAQALTNFFIDREVPQRLFDVVRDTISSPLTFLIVLNIFLLVVGALMDIFSAIMVVVPIITPVALHYGINPIHLGIVFLTNLEIGFNTPPVGVNLFVGSLAFRRPVIELFRAIIPFLLLSFVGLILITYWPDLSLALVRWTGVK
jgi:TRAP-type C4-dicarboxylate transport system permease large subunit